MKIKNHHNKNLDIFAVYIFGIKCCHLSKMNCLRCPKKLFAYDCVTLYCMFCILLYKYIYHCVVVVQYCVILCRGPGLFYQYKSTGDSNVCIQYMYNREGRFSLFFLENHMLHFRFHCGWPLQATVSFIDF